MAAFTSDERTSKTNLPAHVDILRRGSIAASNVPGVGVFIFFQDNDGFIRETQHIKGKYQGGDKASRIKIADDVKYRGPLAAVEGRNQDAVVRLNRFILLLRTAYLHNGRSPSFTSARATSSVDFGGTAATGNGSPSKVSTH